MTRDFNDDCKAYKELKDLTEQMDRMVYFGGKNGRLNLTVLAKINDEICELINLYWSDNL